MSAIGRPFRFLKHNRGVRAFILMILLSAALLAALALTGNSALLPGAFFIGAAAGPAGVIVATQRRTGAFDSVSSGALLTTAVLGGGIALLIGGIFDSIAIGEAGGSSPRILYVGPIEEAVKLIAPVAIAVTGRYLTKLSGVALGIASATGFAVLETMSYGFTALHQNGGGNLLGAELTFINRGLTDPFGHQVWTGAACAVMFAVWQRRGRVSFSWSILGILVTVMGLHSLNDFVEVVTFLPTIVQIPLSLAIMIIGLVIFLRVTRDLTLPAGARAAGGTSGARTTSEADRTDEIGTEGAAASFPGQRGSSGVESTVESASGASNEPGRSATRRRPE